jgi:RNA polymerase sigma-70 factor (ECF subfamily)
LAAARSEYAEQVAQCLAQLPPAAREVVVLRNFEGLPFDDIAVRLGKSTEAVRKVWSRAIRQLQLPPWD